MSQGDQSVANADGATVRNDINAELEVLASLSSGGSAPTTTRAGMLWYDTGNAVIKQRNAANSAWITKWTVASAEGTLVASLIFSPDNTLDIGAAGATRARDLFLARNAVIGGTVYVGDTSNANITQGLTINQGASDDHILDLKSSDVGHGMTSVAEADTYGVHVKLDATKGGLVLAGLIGGGGTVGLVLEGMGEAGDATKSTSGTAFTEVRSFVKSGSSIAADATASVNLFAIKTGTTARFFFDTEGDSHQDVGTAWTNFDEENDVELLTALSVHVSRRGDPIRRHFGEFLQYNRRRLEELRLVTFNDDGHHFVNYSQLTRLLVGAVRQQALAMGELAKRLGFIEVNYLGLK